MGWINESAPQHEGYFVGLVPADNPDGTKSDWRFRELSSAAGDTSQMRPVHVQMACSCGWRSPRLAPPMECRYVPSTVLVPDWFEEYGRRLWHEHIKSEPARAARQQEDYADCMRQAAHESVFHAVSTRPFASPNDRSREERFPAALTQWFRDCRAVSSPAAADVQMEHAHRLWIEGESHGLPGDMLIAVLAPGLEPLTAIFEAAGVEPASHREILDVYRAFISGAILLTSRR